ncbi:MAG: hydroxypyruvate isomerase family protein [Granulosicoccus sp.]
MNLRYSANIGFLWEHLPLPARIAAAAQAGFDAVECHFPYEYEQDDIATVIAEHRIPLIGLNTVLGPPGEGHFGMAAIVGKEALARSYIDQAISYASAVGADNVNVVAGASTRTETSEAVFRENLHYACRQAAASSITILIEPLNPRSVPDYHFSTIEQARATIDAVAEDNLKIMFDFFHTQIVQGDLCRLLQDHLPCIGHIQISAVHDRGEPDIGEINYPYVLDMLDRSNYSGYIGAEYKPRGQSVESGLGWLNQFRSV